MLRLPAGRRNCRRPSPVLAQRGAANTSSPSRSTCQSRLVGFVLAFLPPVRDASLATAAPRAAIRGFVRSSAVAGRVALAAPGAPFLGVQGAGGRFPACIGSCSSVCHASMLGDAIPARFASPCSTPLWRLAGAPALLKSRLPFATGATDVLPLTEADSVCSDKSMPFLSAISCGEAL